MGIADRDYHRTPPRGGGGFLAQLTPVVKWLLIANALIFIIDYLILPAMFNIRVDHLRRPPLVKWGAFSIQSALSELRLWEFITFQFLHDSVGHLLFNSLGLYFFGPWIERWWGSARFLAFYLICGCGGAAFFTLLAVLGVLPGGMETGLIGASAGIYGIFIGVAVVAPDLRVMLLFPPIELSMRQLAIGLMVISTGIVIVGIGDNEGGEAGHLGGAIVGFLLMCFPGLLGKRREAPSHRQPHPGRPYTPKLKPRTVLDTGGDPEVDRILDKISNDGFQSLTQEEKDLLQQAAKQNPDPP